MTTKRTTPKRRFLRSLLLVLTFGAGLLVTRRTTEPAAEPPVYARLQLAPVQLEPEVRVQPRHRIRRLALSGVLTVLFFAGASLSALAGDTATALFDGDGAVATAAEAAATTDTLALSEEPVAPEPAVEPEPALEPELAPVEVAPVQSEPVEVAPAPEPAPVEPQPDTAPVLAPAPPSEPEPAPAHGAPAPAAEAVTAEPAEKPVARSPAAKPAAPPAPVTPAPSAPVTEATLPLDPEAHAPGSVATVWLHRELSDPTPPSLRLSPAVAKRLVDESRRTGASWALVLGLLRADGNRAAPSRGRSIDEAARTLSGVRLDRNGWTVALGVTGRTAAADRALALAHYYRAVGMSTLVDGLVAQQDALAKKVLEDERVLIYGAGRYDIAVGHVDVRILAVIEYLAESFGSVTVSSLISGHRLYARPGVVSAHIFGEALDVAALGGIPIAGHQAPGGLTEQAVREILLLPAEVLPRQVISLLGLGGPSFPLSDHDDHIHIGF